MIKSEGLTVAFRQPLKICFGEARKSLGKIFCMVFIMQ